MKKVFEIPSAEIYQLSSRDVMTDPVSTEEVEYGMENDDFVNTDNILF